MDKTKGYEGIGTDGDFDFTLPYYAIYKNRFITYNWLLRDLLSVEGNKIKLKSHVFQQIKALNNFIFYNDVNSWRTYNPKEMMMVLEHFIMEKTY